MRRYTGVPIYFLSSFVCVDATLKSFDGTKSLGRTAVAIDRAGDRARARRLQLLKLVWKREERCDRNLEISSPYPPFSSSSQQEQEHKEFVQNQLTAGILDFQAPKLGGESLNILIMVGYTCPALVPDTRFVMCR
jgi:hypothetical protein